MLRQFVMTSLLRAWLGFCALYVFGWLAFLVMDGDNPLESDDPYIMGFVCGGYAAAMGIMYSIAEKACASRLGASLCYGAIVGLWALLLVVLSRKPSEATELLIFMAIVHIVSAAISWPLFAFRMPRGMVILISAFGLVILAMYGIVAVRMASMYPTG